MSTNDVNVILNNRPTVVQKFIFKSCFKRIALDPSLLYSIKDDRSKIN